MPLSHEEKAEHVRTFTIDMTPTTVYKMDDACGCRPLSSNNHSRPPPVMGSAHPWHGGFSFARRFAWEN